MNGAKRDFNFSEAFIDFFFSFKGPGKQFQKFFEFQKMSFFKCGRTLNQE